MIGATQLVNSNLDPPSYDGQSAATAYISYDQVANDNGSNGLRWFNDGLSLIHISEPTRPY